MKKLVSVLLAAATLLSLCACKEITYVSPEPAPTDYPVAVGEVTFTEAPLTAASLSPAITEMIFELGYGDKLIGRSKYCDYPEEAKARTDIGSSVKPSIDVILALRPDVLLTQSPIAKTDRDRIEKNGTKVVNIDTPKSYQEMLDCYKTLASIFGGKLTAEAAANACMNDLAVELAGIEKSGTFVYLMTYDYGAATGDTLAGEILSYFGDNIASGNTAYNLPIDELIARQPDTVVLSQDVIIDGFDAEISELDAVRSGRIIYIDSVCFERPTARRVLEFVRSFEGKATALPEMKSFEEETDTEDAGVNE